MKSNYFLWIAIVGIILVGGYYYMSKPNMSYTKPGAPVTSSPTTTTGGAKPITIAMNEQNGLGQSGTATLTENTDGKLMVTLSLSGGTFAAPQPAHIHVGSCPNPGAVKYPLANVENGQSETLIDASWADLVSAGEPLAINVHKSGAESKVYTACGDLPVTENQTMTGADVKVKAPTINY